MSALLDSFARAFDALPGRDAAGLAPARREALDAALRDGLPHARVEAWKYTPLRALERRAFAPSADAIDVDPALVAAIPAPRMVFVNGRFAAALSDVGGLPDGIVARPLSAALAAGDAREVNALARRFDRADEPFARFNAALAGDGLWLRAEGDVAATVHLVLVGAPAEGDVAWHFRHLVELRDDARLALVEHRIAAGTHAHLANEVAHVHLAPGTRLLHARVQDEAAGATQFLRTDAVLGSEATYRRLDLELGGGLTRHELNIALHGERARARANGVLLGRGRSHLDTRLGIDHVARDTACELTWRGLGAGRSRTVFHGGILIRAGADGTSAALSNKNLLLSADAEIDSQPVLEIHADEVQAAHGATVGQLDPTSLFYLRSRGLPAADARALLTAAFCRETLAVVDDEPLRDALGAALDAALARLETP
ncbi:Fe-S cluster assembly protein SufD [Tolypothrix campylonemoides VB511288]|nr:Fe-S cluster assembly protein SufD [Tolypothrix campylonemoides VB511288]